MLTGFRAAAPVRPRTAAPTPKAPPLPADPERLAATAQRLKLHPPATPEPAQPQPATPAPEPLSRRAEPLPATLQPAARHQPATPTKAAKPAPQQPQPPAPTPPRAAPASLRPARPSDAPLPATPPAAKPQVRIRIGALTIVTREARQTPGTPRKSLLAPATRRAGRGHSIPRPVGG
ncbi:hypothetical protein JHW40_06545 [Paracoccus alcaliphilus]|nr:hypothetical protein JHW40_06545 [Paracoccus alcaliphilus]